MMKTIIKNILSQVSSKRPLNIGAEENVIMKFSEAENLLYAQVPELPLPVAPSEEMQASEPESVVSVNDIEIMILNRFAPMGLVLRNLNTVNEKNNLTIDFVVKLRNHKDLENLSNIIHQLKFDLEEDVNVKIFTSSKVKGINKSYKVQISITKIRAANIAYNHANI